MREGGTLTAPLRREAQTRVRLDNIMLPWPFFFLFDCLIYLWRLLKVWCSRPGLSRIRIDFFL